MFFFRMLLGTVSFVALLGLLLALAYGAMIVVPVLLGAG